MVNPELDTFLAASKELLMSPDGSPFKSSEIKKVEKTDLKRAGFIGNIYNIHT